MIHYLPFTYLSDGLISRIVSVVGPFGVCQITDALLPVNMRQWVQNGIVCPVYADELDSDQLQRAIAEFHRWGNIHEGRLTTMAGMCLPDRYRSALLDEQTATRISYLVRQYENQNADSRPNAIFRTALFLAMAQIYDQQQDEVNGTLAGVWRMERELASQLAGDADKRSDSMSTMPSGSIGIHQDHGQVLTDQRISAWAALAFRAKAYARLYLTTSRAVFAALLDRWPEAVQIGKWPLPIHATEIGSTGTMGNSDLNKAIEALAVTADPHGVTTDFGATVDNDDAMLTAYVLLGRKPHEVLSVLAHDSSSHQPLVDHIANTVFGYLSIQDKKIEKLHSS